MQVSVSLVDWLGVVEDGISVILSLNLEGTIYEIIYWFNREGDYRFVIEEKFLTRFNLTDIYTYEHFPLLIRYIDLQVLPPREEIFKEFNL